MLPTFISGWDGKALKARVAFGAPDQETLAPPENALERRYALRVADALVIGALPYPRSLSAQRNGERASILGGSVTCSDFCLWLGSEVPDLPIKVRSSSNSRHSGQGWDGPKSKRTFGRKVGQETEKFAMKNANYDVNRPRQPNVLPLLAG